MGLGGANARAADRFNAFSVLGSRDGFAIDFTKNRMVVNDANNPANEFDGNPQSKLTVYGADPWQVDAKGFNLSAARDFAIAMSTGAFPYDPAALHIYARFTLNGADSADQRYLFMVDNSGNDRFAMYTTSGAGFRLVTGDGASSDTEVSALSLVADTEYRTFVGADALGVVGWMKRAFRRMTSCIHCQLQRLAMLVWEGILIRCCGCSMGIWQK